jgi:hypothetical protein
MAKIKEAIEDFRPDQRLVDERGPTPERVLKTQGEFVTGKGRKTITVRDAPIERMLARDVITEKQYNGLTKYRIHWYHAGIAGNMGAINMDGVRSTNLGAFGLGNTDRQVFHLQQYQRGVTALGLRRSSVVEAVVCLESESLEAAGRRLSWGNKAQAIAAATEVLRGAADDLCDIWGLS